MTTLPRRAARDLRVLAGSPLAVTIAVLFCRRRRARRSRSSRVKARPIAGSRCPGADGGSDVPNSSASWPRRPVCRLSIPAEGAKVLIVEVQRLSVPGVRPVVSTPTSRLSRSTRHSSRARCSIRDQGLSARIRMQRECHRERTPSGSVRSGRRRAAGAGAQSRQAMEEWLFTNQPTHDAARRAAGGAGRGPGHRFRREVRLHAGTGQGRRRARPSAWRQVDSDVLHQRRQVRRRAGRRSTSIRRSRTSCSAQRKIAGGMRSGIQPIRPLRKPQLDDRSARHVRAHQGLRGRLLAQAARTAHSIG